MCRCRRGSRRLGTGGVVVDELELVSKKEQFQLAGLVESRLFGFVIQLKITQIPTKFLETEDMLRVHRHAVELGGEWHGRGATEYMTRCIHRSDFKSISNRGCWRELVTES